MRPHLHLVSNSGEILATFVVNNHGVVEHDDVPAARNALAHEKHKHGLEKHHGEQLLKSIEKTLDGHFYLNTKRCHGECKYHSSATLFGLSPELEQIVDAFANQYGVVLPAEESQNAVTFDTIDIPEDNRGSGVGTRIMRQLKAYCDRTGKELRVKRVTNRKFFDSLTWMEPEGMDEYVYTPNLWDSTEPTMRDSWDEGYIGEDELHHNDVSFSGDTRMLS